MTLLWLAVLLQPMPDPRQMSGIPMPSPDLPPGTLSVRLTRGDLRQAIVGEEVTVVVGRDRRSAETGPDGRAIFRDLPTALDMEVQSGGARSSTFQLGATGVRMMMFVGEGVTKTAESTPGQATLPSPSPPPGMPHAAQMSGIPLPSPDLPAGTLSIRIAYGGLTETLPATEVELEILKGQGVMRQKATSDQAGRARFDGLPLGAQATAIVVHHGETFSTAAFKISGESGLRMLLFVAKAKEGASNSAALATGKVTHDRTSIAVGARSHIIVEPGEDDTQILEVVEIENSGVDSYDPGAAGLPIWLPEGQSTAATDEDTPQEVRVEDGKLVWKGLVAPGTHAVRFFFRRSVEGDRLSFRQRTELAWPDVTIVVRDSPGIVVEGSDVTGGDLRDLGNQKFRVFHVPGVKANGTIAFSVRGLPRPDTRPRTIAAALALMILTWGVFSAWRRRPS